MDSRKIAELDNKLDDAMRDLRRQCGEGWEIHQVPPLLPGDEKLDIAFGHCGRCRYISPALPAADLPAACPVCGNK